MHARLPIICLAETDHSKSACRWKKTENMQPSLQVSHRNQAILFVANLVEVGSRSEIEFGGLLESEAALTTIALALPWVERDLHINDCTGKLGSET
jgi:hypothetical protein